MAITSLTVLYLFFGLVCYLAFGQTVDPIITEMLPRDSIVTIAIKVAFCLNLIFGYSICVNPTNTIIESWIFGGMRASIRRRRLKNLSRAFVCLAAVLVSVKLGDKISSFLGLLGAMVCTPLALTIPTCLHLKVLADSKTNKVVD